MPFNIEFGGKKKGKLKTGLEKITGGSTGMNNDNTIIPRQVIEHQNTEETLESDINEEVSETLGQFRESVRNEMNRRMDNIDQSFYSVLVFNTNRQRVAFMKAIGIKCDEKTNLRFINGVKLAELLNIELPPSSSEEAGRFRVNREILSFCLNPKKQTNG